MATVSIKCSPGPREKKERGEKRGGEERTGF